MATIHIEYRTFCLNWVCSQKSGSHGYIISCMQLLVCEYQAIDIQETVKDSLRVKQS